MSTIKITPEYVLKLTKPTDKFLCPLSANTSGIEFLSFKIRDADTQHVFFDVEKDRDKIEHTIDPQDLDSVRKIRYKFPREFLSAKHIGTTLVFSVGDKPIQNFRMIERHYFKDKLLKSFDFTFKFCIPNSTNSWECIYELPTLTKEQIDDIIANPYETKSDSFYFINNSELIMHNKADYAYL